jgi:hypothetical protein
MAFERRLLALLLLTAAIGAPALGLRLLCVGNACDRAQEVSADIPFCSLPPELRRLIAAGFREGPAPDVLAVAEEAVAGGTLFERPALPPWPSAEAGNTDRVSLGFWTLEGGELSPALDRVPAGTGLDDVAPTVAALLEVERPHPEVRSGRPLPGAGPAAGAELALQIVWKGVGAAELRDATGEWPVFEEAVSAGGTLEAGTASLPLDPAAVLTTIGTGGTPSQHGVTGSLVRNEAGRVVPSFGKGAPTYVIATLGDDLDEVTDGVSEVGLVASDRTDRGLIGKGWYVDDDRDEVVVVPRPARGASRAVQMLSDLSEDGTPDLMAIALAGSIEEMNEATERILAAAAEGRRSPVIVSFATAGSPAPSGAFPADDLVRLIDRSLPGDVDPIEALAPGGLFLDQEALTAEDLTEDRVVDAVRRLEDDSGKTVFADVFAAIAVSFGRYC